MKIKASPLIGEASGKLGSVVFSRNSAGPYVRVWVQPVNHRSLAQVNHRQAFSIASALWCTLADHVKEEWNNYAKDPVRFAPIYKMNTGGINGLNAYIAHSLEVYHANTLKSFTSIVSSTPPGISLNNNIPFTVPSTPPYVPCDGTLFGKQLTFTCNIVADTNASILLTISPIDGPTSPILVPPNTPLLDGHTNPVSFALYISTSKKNTPNFSKKLVRKIVNTPIAENNTNDPIPVSQLSFTATYPTTQNFVFPQPGELVDVTLAMVTVTGQVRKIGMQTVEIQAPSP